MLLAIALILAASAASAADPGGPAPVWPLDLPERHLTSNFMEYRGGRYHAGLDFKTRSREGFAVRAVEDGWIVRVRATPTAYGRALYLRGESGRTYVYAHLARFNDTIRARVEAARQRSGRYRVRLEPRPGEIPVRRGEVLALSGQSGTGGPHLHFEVRDADNRPVDPQAVGFAVPDTMAPRIFSLRAIPASPAARIAGSDTARVLRAPAGGSLVGALPPLAVDGPVAFTASIVEFSDIRGHRLEPYLLAVDLDGRRVYECRNESFGFGENDLQRLEWLEGEEIRERWLHRRPGATVEGRRGDAWPLGDGAGLVPGRHDLVITAADRAGNSTSVSLVLKVGAAERAGPESSAWVADPVRVELSEDNANYYSYLSPLFDVSVEVSGWGLLQLEPGGSDPVLAPLTLAHRPAGLTAEQGRRAAAQGLHPAGPAVAVAAADWPVSGAPELAVPGLSLPDSGRAAWGLYRWRRDRWRPGGDLLDGGAAGAEARLAVEAPGLHAVFADRAAPWIGAPADTVRLQRAEPTGVPGVTAPHWRIVAVTVQDEGSGWDHAASSVTLDGAVLPAEPDAPRHRLLLELPAGLAPGPHRIRVEAVDRAGNRAERSFVVLAPSAAAD